MFTRTFFRVVLATEFGEKVAVVGSEPQLGNWNIEQCHHLVTNEDVFPAWFSTKPVLLPLKKKVAYKYVVLDQNNELVRWEEIEGDRDLTPTGAEMLVEDDNGFIRTKTEASAHSASEVEPLSTPLPPEQEQQMEVQQRLLSAHDDPVAIDANDALLVVAFELPIRVVRLEPSSIAQEGVTSGACVQTHQNRASSETPFGKQSDEMEQPPQLRDGSGEVVSCAVSRHGRFCIQPSKCTLLPSLFHLRSKTQQPSLFIGWPGVFCLDPSEEEEVEELLRPFGCHPVFSEPQEIRDCLRFCNEFMRPLFHNVLSVDPRKQQPYDPQLWAAFLAVNKRWGAAVARLMQENDLVWLHDFHLLTAAMHITRKNRKANIGLFLHVPFPSSEIFRCLPCREEVRGSMHAERFCRVVDSETVQRRVNQEGSCSLRNPAFPQILRGMLCADLIGFHFFEYARHFLVTCKRLLGLEHCFRRGGTLGIDFGGRNVLVRIGHVNIMYDHLQRSLRESPCKRMAAKIRDRWEGRYIFASVDRCEPLAGLLLKVHAFDRFLASYPYAVGKVGLVQYAYPTSVDGEDDKIFSFELEELVEEVNAKYRAVAGCEHIELKIGPVEWEERCSLFMAADCLLDCCIRDGLNLNPFEYLCCRSEAPCTAVILSEFTGCSRALASPMRVNPWNRDAVAAAMDRAVSSGEELTFAVSRDRAHMQLNSTLNWAEDFVMDLARAKKSDDVLYSTMGLGTTYRMLGIDSHFAYLETQLVVNAYRSSRRRVFFFDCEGTLAPDQRRLAMIEKNGEQLFAAGTPPSAAVKSCLQALISDSKNTVVILSGRDRTLLEDWFKELKGIGLCAEHGYYYRLDKITGDEWCCMCPQSDFTWKSVAMELMLQYVKRTQGSFIENKGSALVFQYRDADPEFGQLQAKDLSSFLIELLFGYPVTVVSGKGYVEVKLLGVNKGKAVERILKTITNMHGAVDFVLCIGDDRAPMKKSFSGYCFTSARAELLRIAKRSDEDMFVVMNGMTSAGGTLSLPASTGPNESSRITHTGREQKPTCKSEESSCLANHSHESEAPHFKTFGSGHHQGEQTRRDSAREPHIFTCTVGKKPSDANYYLHDTGEVSELLDALRVVSDKEGVHHSRSLESGGLMGSWGSLLEPVGSAAPSCVPLDVLRRRHFMRGGGQAGAHAKVASVEECLAGASGDSSSQNREGGPAAALTRNVRLEADSEGRVLSAGNSANLGASSRSCDV